MVIFHSYVSLPEGKFDADLLDGCFGGTQNPGKVQPPFIGRCPCEILHCLHLLGKITHRIHGAGIYTHDGSMVLVYMLT